MHHQRFQYASYVSLKSIYLFDSPSYFHSLPKLITSFAEITSNPLVLSMCPFQYTPISSSSPTLLPEQSFHVHVHFHFNLSKTLPSLSLPSWGKDSAPYKACELLYSMVLWPFQSHWVLVASSHATPAARTFVVLVLAVFLSATAFLHVLFYLPRVFLPLHFPSQS